MKIIDLIPDPQVTLGLSPEELAFSLLRVASENRQNGLAGYEYGKITTWNVGVRFAF